MLQSLGAGYSSGHIEYGNKINEKDADQTTMSHSRVSTRDGSYSLTGDQNHVDRRSSGRGSLTTNLIAEERTNTHELQNSWSDNF